MKPADLLDEALGRPGPGAEGWASSTADPEIADLAGLAQELRRLAPPPAGKAARYRVWAQLRRDLQPSRASRPAAHRGALTRRPAYALVSLLLAFALVGASTGAVFASEDAVPGDPLYPLKRGVERARIALTWTDEGDAVLLLQFADERLREAEAVASWGDEAAVDEALRGYDQALDQLMELAERLPQVDGRVSVAGIEQHIGRQIEILQRVQGQVPPQAAEVIGAVIERATERQQQAERIRGGGRPEVTPPGQVGRTPGPPENRAHGPDDDRPGRGNNGRPPGNEEPTETPGAP